MTTIIERLDLNEYEAELHRTDSPNREEDRVIEDERVVDDDEVARLLLSTSELEQLDYDRAPAAAFEPSDDRDGLSAMRGIMIGLAWVAPFWTLVAAIMILT